jgi:hexosaminidase
VLPCWQTDPSIKADKDGGGTLSQLLERYVRAVHPQVTSKN